MLNNDIKIKATGVDLPQSVVNYIYDKIGGLKKYLEKKLAAGSVDITAEIGRTTRHHRQGLVYRAECNIALPGKVLRGVHEDWDARRCIDEIKQELQEQIKDYLAKSRPQDSRGQEELRKLRGK
jgi:putative sigma-54 modulation protein